MGTLVTAAGVLTVALLGYLLVALLFPEKLS